MTGTSSENQHDDQANVEVAERLITRIIDGEVDSEDRERFERMASNDPSLWRTLVQRQQDMLELSVDVEHELAVAFRVNIDRAQEHRAALGADASGVQWHRPLWWIGWAAAVVLAAAWVIVATMQSELREEAGVTTVPALGSGDRLTSEQHLHRYLASPFVVGELDPIMLQYEKMNDGRIEFRILRRIEETYLLDADEPLPIDADGRLIGDPAELQRRSH